MLNSADMLSFLKIQIKLPFSSFEVVISFSYKFIENIYFLDLWLSP